MQKELRERLNEFLDKQYTAKRICEELGFDEAYFCRWRKQNGRDLNYQCYRILNEFLNKH